MTNNIEHTTWFRKWNTTFFTASLILFLIAYIHFELTGEMTGTGRLIFGGMMLLLIYGWIRSIVLLRAVLTADRQRKEPVAKEVFDNTETKLFSETPHLRNIKPSQASKK